MRRFSSYVGFWCLKLTYDVPLPANCEKMLEKERALATPEARRVALQHLAGDSVGKRTSCAITHRVRFPRLFWHASC